ncbi:MAG: FAD-dependent oxidoreductase [Chloroflexi bacterium]|nr:FAD-dependent oxidoreductase [Chloroflexota bacterium]MCI0579118.1 FAD-dependent oxidoreductase [Chloroflexota bacterium]MCI0643335.1 FAD-dependent oxidoreductase [Chloroflexota bacterium]MCI0728314.1 FAD-dependent oxidoreductase [Chloroflexota bacterium]
MTRTVVLGAGLAGLRAGVALAAAGHEVTLLEKEPEAGGIARTISLNSFLFDHGPHGFHSRDNDLVEEFKTFVGEGNYHRFAKRSRIYFNGAYFDYPLKLRDLAFNMGPNRLASALFSYLYARIQRALDGRKASNAEEYLVGQFGRVFYDAFFGPYTARVWGISPSRIDADFIEDRVPHVSLGSVIKQLFLPDKKPRLSPSGRPIVHDIHYGYYPKYGIQVLSEGLARCYRELGGHLCLSTRPVAIDTADRRIIVRQNGEAHDLAYDHVVSTIPLDSLIRLITPEPPPEVQAAVASLVYRPVVLVCLCINRPQVFDVFWVYYAEGEFNRISEIKHFSPHLAPEGKTGLCVEISSSPEELQGAGDETFYRRSVAELKKIKLLDEAEIEDYFVIRETNAYPIYHIGYRDTLKTLLDFVKSRGIETAGRQGEFSYINMDQAMRSGREAAGRVIAAAANVPLTNYV